MKRLIALLSIVCLAAACGEGEPVVFYSMTYTVTRIDAQVTLETPPPGTDNPTQPDDPEDPETPENPDNSDNPDTDAPGEPGEGESPDTDADANADAGDPETPDGPDGEDPGDEPPSAADLLAAEVIAAAPVQAGGWYRLDFNLYNGGPLTVAPTGDAVPFVGEFIKEPGAAELQFAYNEASYAYTISSYLSSEGVRCVMLVIDLTEEYQTLYPEAGLTRVQRREYTSTPY